MMGRRSENVGEEDEEGVVGWDEDVKLMLGTSILNDGQGLSTSLITGMVGIGKTTLARKLYNQKSVAQRFKRRAWVCVSSELK